MSSSSIPKQTKAWIVANPPAAEIQQDTFKLETRDIPELKDGEVLVKVSHLSNDPAQRGWMQKDADEHRLYVPPIRAGEVMRSGGLGKVVASKSSKYQEGDEVQGMVGWTEFVVLKENEIPGKAVKIEGHSPVISLSSLGMVAMTAWTGLHRVGEIKSEHTVLISGAAGATGSMAVQIAKKLVGCKRVVGIAGGPEKCKWVESLGADKCVDYKSKTFLEDLKAATPDYADVYFENVGGDVLNAVLPRIKRWGKIIACGMISSYNGQPVNVPNLMEIITNRITMTGFIVFDFLKDWPEATKELTEAIKAGKITTEKSETIVDTKFDEVPKTWQKLFEGANQGKLITQLL